MRSFRVDRPSPFNSYNLTSGLIGLPVGRSDKDALCFEVGQFQIGVTCCCSAIPSVLALCPKWTLAGNVRAWKRGQQRIWQRGVAVKLKPDEGGGVCPCLFSNLIQCTKLTCTSLTHMHCWDRCSKHSLTSFNSNELTGVLEIHD